MIVSQFIVTKPYRAPNTRPASSKADIKTRTFQKEDVVVGILFPADKKNGVPEGVVAHGEWFIPTTHLEFLADLNEKDAAAELRRFEQANPDVSAPQEGKKKGKGEQKPVMEAEENAYEKVEKTNIVQDVIDKSKGTTQGVLWGAITGGVLGLFFRRPFWGAAIGAAAGAFIGYNYLTEDKLKQISGAVQDAAKKEQEKQATNE